MKKMFRSFLLLVVAVMLWSVAGWSAFSFTLDYRTNDVEEWTFTSLIGDTAGTLTFRNTNYGLHPIVIFVPNAANSVANNTWLGTPTATTVVVNQDGGVGAGAGRIIVIRRR